MFTPNQYRAKAVEYGELVKTSTGPNQRREFQQLKQCFTVLADNEQWLADNHKNTVRAPEQDRSNDLAEEEEQCPAMPWGSADHAVEYLANKAAKGALRQCRLHG